MILAVAASRAMPIPSCELRQPGLAEIFGIRLRMLAAEARWPPESSGGQRAYELMFRLSCDAYGAAIVTVFDLTEPLAK